MMNGSATALAAGVRAAGVRAHFVVDRREPLVSAEGSIAEVGGVDTMRQDC